MMNAWISDYIWPNSFTSDHGKEEEVVRMIPRLHSRQATILACSLLLMFSIAGGALDKKDKSQGRLLSGKVLDRQDNPVVGAVVYLTNTRTHAIKTYIVGQDGTYRFPGLSSVDYEVYAQYNNRKSDTRSVSQFDDRAQVYIDLKIDTH
jgi:Carboxypeptidase regulatory-like domain